MLGLFLILLGSFGVIATHVVIWWLVNFGCGMNTTGCRTDGLTLFLRFIVSAEAWFYWFPLILSVALVASGLHMRHVDKRPPSP
ncbi:hypothetical protein [Paracoccus shanxieyensis]|uniref:Transmembrane protein n=1 Tax=Paracoccus shanxieyensis TaxID=2675752 RepID=A0A6L6IZD5_9RHOB|nr:hypothetical protein [Paracoccus shanxieyensis]MTH65885.1 hypothetical protein [Paracoccus shanxieyensis]MTH89206.1 hypothetical protein [Paracoccus shanxieyensis]